MNPSTNQSAAPTVSVLMNCLNGEKYLREAIDSVYAQTFKDWEIIFWDNCSTDRTAEIAQSYTQSNDPRLRYFRGTETVPLYTARNLALQKARGKFIAVLDVDDVWMPAKLEKQVPLFNNPKVGLVYCDTLYFNEDKIFKQLYKTRAPYTGMCFRELCLDYFLSLETVVYRKEALDSLTYYFDPRFNMVGDADIARRLGLTWELAMVNEPLAKWRIHGENLSFKKFERHIDETEMMARTYQETIPGFSEKYADVLHGMLRSVALMRAKQWLLKGEPKKSRAEIKPYLNSKKSLALYLASYVPPPIFRLFFGQPRT